MNNSTLSEQFQNPSGKSQKKTAKSIQLRHIRFPGHLVFLLPKIGVLIIVILDLLDISGMLIIVSIKLFHPNIAILFRSFGLIVPNTLDYLAGCPISQF